MYIVTFEQFLRPTVKFVKGQLSFSDLTFYFTLNFM